MVPRPPALVPGAEGTDRGILRDVLAETTRRGFAIDDIATRTLGAGQPPAAAGRPVVQVTLHVHGRAPVTDLAAALSEISDVSAVLAADANTTDE